MGILLTALIFSGYGLDVDAAKEKQPAKDTNTAVETEAVYDTMIMAQVNNALNIRKTPSTSAKVVGKLNDGAVASIIQKGKVWCKIKSGSVTGYIMHKYTITGEELEAYAKSNVGMKAIINVDSLNIRKKSSTNADVLATAKRGQAFPLIKEGAKWLKIKAHNTGIGYIAKEFAGLEYDFEYALSLETDEVTIEKNETPLSGNTKPDDKTPSAGKPEATKPNGKVSRQAIVDYAVQFVGNPYVYGGTSLTQGADCSGFVMSVLSNFGINIQRVSSSQATDGVEVAIEDIQPADLVFYGKGGKITHVAMYIGNGQIVQAWNAEKGICITNMNYSTPVNARNVVGDLS